MIKLDAQFLLPYFRTSAAIQVKFWVLFVSKYNWWYVQSSQLKTTRLAFQVKAAPLLLKTF